MHVIIVTALSPQCPSTACTGGNISIQIINLIGNFIDHLFIFSWGLKLVLISFWLLAWAPIFTLSQARRFGSDWTLTSCISPLLTNWIHGGLDAL